MSRDVYDILDDLEQPIYYPNLTKSSVIGIEIEVKFLSQKYMLQRLEKAISFGPIRATPDGSLSDYLGIEFIFNTTPFDEIVSGCFIDKWCEFVTPITASTTMSEYGMHLSINTSRISKLGCAKICWFVNSIKRFAKKISPRVNPFSDYYYSWSKGLDSIDAEDYMDKYTATSIRNKNRIEFRFFQSTTNFATIKKACEFADSCRRFAPRTSIKNLTFENYVAFLKRNFDKYPNILAMAEQYQESLVCA
jgi:hypothetical protein